MNQEGNRPVNKDWQEIAFGNIVSMVEFKSGDRLGI